MKDYFEIYRSEETIIRVEGTYCAWQGHTAEKLTKVKEPGLGIVWIKKEYPSLWALSNDVDSPDLFCSFVHLKETYDAFWTERDAASEGDDDAKLAMLESEELTISFFGTTSRIYFCPAADEILNKAIKLGIAESLCEF